MAHPLSAVPLSSPFKLTFEPFPKEWIFIVFCCRAAKRGSCAPNRWHQLACFPWNLIQIQHCIISHRRAVAVCWTGWLTVVLASCVQPWNMDWEQSVSREPEWRVLQSSWTAKHPGSSRRCRGNVYERSCCLLGLKFRGNCWDEHFGLEFSLILVLKHWRGLYQTNVSAQGLPLVGKTGWVEWTREWCLGYYLTSNVIDLLVHFTQLLGNTINKFSDWNACSKFIPDEIIIWRIRSIHWTKWNLTPQLCLRSLFY